MKRRFPRYLTLLLGLLAASCVTETARFEENGEKTDDRNIGYLTFEQLEMTVVDRTEDIDHRPESYAATRAGNTDVESYTVEILDANGRAVEVTDKNGVTGTAFTYGDRPDLIELPVGAYTLSVYSGPTKEAAWEGEEGTPTYGATQNVTITKGNTTALQDMTCRLLSVKVAVAYKDTLIATMSENTTAEVVLGEKNALVFEGKEPAGVGYLKPAANQSNPLVLYLTTTFNGKQIDRQPLVVTQDAKAGQYRNITVGLQHAEDGTVIINAEIETWLENDEIVVDCQEVAVTAFCEDRIPDENDPDAPKLEWPGHSLDETYLLDDTKFDENGYYNEPCDFTIRTTVPMTSLLVEVATDNAGYRSLLDAAELTGPKDMFTVEGKARTALRSWGFPAVNLNVTERTFPLSELMKVLYDYEGNHVFTLTIADEADRKSVYELKIEVKHDTGDAPKIVWIGHEAQAIEGKTQAEIEAMATTVTDDLDVRIRITAPKGIQSLDVEISGALDVSDVGMPSKFDLVDPDATKEGLSETLGKDGFGFPVGAEVAGQTDIEFDITQFLSLMGTFPGATWFTLTVTDMDSNRTQRAIILRIVEE